MTTDRDIERIRQVVAEHARLPVDASTLGDDDDLFEAGMTSHASVNVMLALEDELDIEFPQATLRKATFRSVAAMAEVVGVLTGDPLTSATAVS